MASTLKLENVAPPISGSVVSKPSRAKTVATPRWPLTANCWVKLAAPLASVIVPAARSNNLLKARALRGKLDTSALERGSATPDCAELSTLEETAKSSRPDAEIRRDILSGVASLTTTGVVAFHSLSETFTEI